MSSISSLTLSYHNCVPTPQLYSQVNEWCRKSVCGTSVSLDPEKLRIIRNTKAPPATPRHTATRSIPMLAQRRRLERRKDAASRHRSGQEKYNQVLDPKQVERGGIRTRNCCINVNYVRQMCRERDCGEGMAVEMLNKQSSVEWWMATPDRTI